MARRVESAEEYVRFYRFWSWEYVKRNSRFREIADLLRRVDADIEAQKHEAPNLDDVIEQSTGLMGPGNAVMLEGATVQDQALAALLAEKVEELGLDGVRDPEKFGSRSRGLRGGVIKLAALGISEFILKNLEYIQDEKC